jgi:RNA polymerase primary sigma factor
LSAPRAQRGNIPVALTQAPPITLSLPELPAEILPETPEHAPEHETVNDHSAYRLYLQEIGQTKLLTPAEEVSLAKRIRRGDKNAREQMIKANLRLVVKIARDYEGYGVPLLDLISEGNIGLIKAVERYDPNKGAKLSTYSAWWIKQAIRRALSNQSKTIRLPVHVVDKLTHMRRAEASFFDEFGREPTDDELSAEIGLPVKRIRQYRQASMSASSLDAPLGDEDSNRVSDIVADERADTPYQQLEEENDTRMVRDALETLNPREKRILQLRFGLDDNDEQTLEELGVQFGLTRERIRQIQELALRKLRKKMAEMEKSAVAA